MTRGTTGVPADMTQRELGVMDHFSIGVVSVPDVFQTSPKRSRPSAVPPACPGYQAMTTAGTCASQGMSMPLPPSSTTTIGLPSAATAVMSGVLNGLQPVDGRQLGIEAVIRAAPSRRSSPCARVVLPLVLGSHPGHDDHDKSAPSARLGSDAADVTVIPLGCRRGL